MYRGRGQASKMNKRAERTIVQRTSDKDEDQVGRVHVPRPDHADKVALAENADLLHSRRQLSLRVPTSF